MNSSNFPTKCTNFWQIWIKFHERAKVHLSHSMWRALPENVVIPSAWSTVGPSYVTESRLSHCDRKSPVDAVTLAAAECYNAVKLDYLF